MTSARPMPLSRMLAIRMTITAAAVSCLLLLFFATQYVLFPEDLARQTLSAEATAIAEMLAHGGNPADGGHYRLYPHAYAFRAVDLSGPVRGHAASAANPGLLPDEDDPTSRLDEHFGPLPGPSGIGWTQTSIETGGGRAYWVQVAMLSDPAWRLRFALGEELLRHVLVPVLFLVPTLTAAMLLTTRRALRPLARIAEQARIVGAAATSGAVLSPLSSSNLPKEFADVVSALNAMLGRLDHALARQRQFASDAAHELRTPLSVLRLQIAALPHSAATERLDEEVAALAHLIDQLLRFTQAEDVMARERRPIDVVATVRETCEELAPLALAQGQELEFVAPANGVVLPSHRELLGVVVRNLVENALRASPSGSTVTIRVEPDGSVAVEDQGPGVPEGQKNAIFERLWRADRERKDGAGIGLALVRRIAQLHGGDVAVANRPGDGARVVVRLRPLPAD